MFILKINNCCPDSFILMKLNNPHQITGNQAVGVQIKKVILVRLSRLYCSD